MRPTVQSIYDRLPKAVQVQMQRDVARSVSMGTNKRHAFLRSFAGLSGLKIITEDEFTAVVSQLVRKK